MPESIWMSRRPAPQMLMTRMEDALAATPDRPARLATTLMAVRGEWEALPPPLRQPFARRFADLGAQLWRASFEAIERAHPGAHPGGQPVACGATCSCSHQLELLWMFAGEFVSEIEISFFAPRHSRMVKHFDAGTS